MPKKTSISRALRAYPEPLYISRPLLPELDVFQEKLREVWGSGWLTNNGPQHQVFERKVQGVLGVPHLALFNNGTIALIVACQSLRLSGEVITTPFTFPATPHVLSWNGISPIFCDIDPVTMNIDAERIESLITPQTTAILGVHVFGTPCDVIKIQEIADRYGLKVVYDAAHAFGAELDGVGIGNFGDISMFSFHATKLFHTAEGGALAFKDKFLQDRIYYLKNFGIKNEFEVVMPGINGKMNELQAALGLTVLDCLDAERQKRARLLELYRELLSGVEGLTLPPELPSQTAKSYQYFAVRIDKKLFGRSRDEVFEEFRKYNVYVRKYFYPLCSDYSCYRHLASASAAKLPVANKVVQEILCLPFYGGLAAEDLENISRILLSLRKPARSARKHA